jgi:MFS family permease
MHRLTRLATPLRQRELRTLFGAQLISGLGDWAGRLALAVVVFDRSDSALWAAAVTVVSLLPWLGLGQLLTTFADRFGRVSVMIASDVIRAVLFAAMLIDQPTWSLLVLAFAAGLCVPPFVGSRASALIELADADQYQPALALFAVVTQTEILLGYVVGGALVAALGANTALAVNAATFLVSAALLTRLRSSAASTRDAQATVGVAAVTAGVRIWFADRVCLRALVLFVGVNAFMILPEALVVPFADEIDVPAGFVGVLAACIAVGSMLGAVFAPTGDDHVALLRSVALRGGAVAAATGALFCFSDIAAVALGAYALSGIVDATAVPTNQIVGQRLPAAGRAAAITVANGALYTSQVVSITVAGVAAAAFGSVGVLAVAMFAAVGTCIAVVTVPLRDSRAEPPVTTAAGRLTGPAEDRS